MLLVTKGGAAGLCSRSYGKRLVALASGFTEGYVAFLIIHASTDHLV